ncbi:MAG: bile acid:sodium symporter family protein [Candidatus Sumerlaeaceae bacterium]|nr:bile acid:sodium symporter family protein [Candidatus Sumerlaeaceae bacterium]
MRKLPASATGRNKNTKIDEAKTKPPSVGQVRPASQPWDGNCDHAMAPRAVFKSQYPRRGGWCGIPGLTAVECSVNADFCGYASPIVKPTSPMIVRIAHMASRFVVIWILLFGAIALLWPSPFLPIKAHIDLLLGVVMFGMGMTLTAEDFRRVARTPLAVGVGIAGQFVIMPLAGFLIAKALNLPWEIAVGVVLVGVCPSGTASNVVTYLAGADVALSVSVTAINTMLSPLLTPLLLKLFAGGYVQVEAVKMFTNILMVVVVPVVAGLAFNTFLPRLSRRLTPFCPLVSVLGIVLIVSYIIAANSGRLSSFGPLVVLAVILHNTAGYAGGYWLARAARLSEAQCRAIAFEIGIQNSALDIQLATKFYSAHAAMTLPGAFFSVWQNLSGPALASWWARKKTR